MMRCCTRFTSLWGARYCSREPYAILIFHDRYDVPVKASDKERQGESEEVYEYLIGAVAPLVGEYEPGRPACGFLYPAFADRSTDDAHVALFGQIRNTKYRCLKNYFSHGSRGRLCRKRYKMAGFATGEAV